MKINTRARYALRLMLDMALNINDDKPLNLKEISERQKISKRYLGQIVVSLKNNSLVKGLAGKSGGYILAKKPEDITVGEIFRAALGPINVVDCVIDPDFCMKSSYCECRPVYVLINQRITESLSEFTLADLVETRSRLDSFPMIDGESGTDMCSSAHK